MGRVVKFRSKPPLLRNLSSSSSSINLLLSCCLNPKPETTTTTTTMTTMTTMSDLDETQMRKSSQLCPPYLNTNSYLSQKLEDFIHVTDPNHHHDKHKVVDERRILLSKEELRLEREIIRLIHTGKSETLKPNSLQSVVVNEHHICVACREDTDPDYRVWEWHGHIMFNDPENGFTPEYVYGNYFEKTLMKELADEDEQYYEEEEEKEEDDDGLLMNLGLRDLINGGNSINGRIIQFRNMTLSMDFGFTFFFRNFDANSLVHYLHMNLEGYYIIDINEYSNRVQIRSLLGHALCRNPNLFSSKFSFAVSSRSGHECSSYCDKLVSSELTAAELKFTGGNSGNLMPACVEVKPVPVLKKKLWNHLLRISEAVLYVS